MLYPDQNTPRAVDDSLEGMLSRDSSLLRSLYGTYSVPAMVAGTDVPGITLGAIAAHSTLPNLWYGGKAIGLFSSLKDPFSGKHQVWAARSKHPAGVLGRTLDVFNKGGRTDLLRQWRWNEAHGAVDGSRMTLLHRYLLKPGKFLDELRDIDPKLHEHIIKTGGEKKLGEYVLRGMPQHREIQRGMEWAGVHELAAAGTDISNITSRAGTAVDQYLRAQRNRSVSVLGTLKTGIKGLYSNTARREFEQQVAEMVGYKTKRKKLTLWYSSSPRNASMYGRVRTAHHEALKRFAAEQAETAGILEGTLEQEAARRARTQTIAKTSTLMDDTALSAIQRIRRARTAKLVVGAATVAMVGTELLGIGMRAAIELPTRAAGMTRSLFKADFGSDTVVESSRVATERMRAVQAIQNSQMNARYLMGNEAMMYR